MGSPDRVNSADPPPKGSADVTLGRNSQVHGQRGWWTRQSDDCPTAPRPHGPTAFRPHGRSWQDPGRIHTTWFLPPPFLSPLYLSPEFPHGRCR